MRKYLLITTAVVALIAVSVAGAVAAGNQPVTVRAGNLEMTFNGGFTPTTLSKTKLTPISLNVSGKLKTVDGTHPPALKEFVVETDKNGAINVNGLPVCKASQLQSQDTKHAEAICKSAIIGSGQATAEIAFPEQKPILAKNGSRRVSAAARSRPSGIRRWTARTGGLRESPRR